MGLIGLQFHRIDKELRGSADEICAALRETTRDTPAVIKEIARSGHVELFPINQPAAFLKRQLQRLLGGE